MVGRCALLTGIAALFLATGAAHATADFCIVVTESPDGFVALREGPGTQFKIIAKLKPGFPLDADTAGQPSKWTRVWIAARRSAWIYTKYTRQIDCPE
jgi:hypothetical protein